MHFCYPSYSARRAFAAVSLVFAGLALSCGTYPALAEALTTTTKIAMTSGGSSVVTIAAGKTVTLTATVTSAGSPVTTGQVSFCDAKAKYCIGTHLIGLAQLTAIGKATLSLRPAAGSHSYKAVFAPTVNDAGSSSGSTTLVVTQSGAYPTGTAIEPGGGPGTYTLTATVGGSGPTAPTGTVSFLDASNGNAVLGNAALSAQAGVVGLVSSQRPATIPGSSPAVADFNGDGIPDIALWNETVSGKQSLDVWLGKGDGSFTLASSYPQYLSQPLALVAGDFNQDGIQDLALGYQCYESTSCSSSVYGVYAGGLLVLLGNGDGTFSLLNVNFDTSKSPIFGLAVGDFNGDGIPDLAARVYCPGGCSSDTLTKGMQIFLGSGNGAFVASQTLTLSGMVSIPNFVVADFNGDGLSDLALVESPGGGGCAEVVGTVNIFLTDKTSGTLTPVSSSPATGPYPSSLAVGDFNSDGIADLAVLNGDAGGCASSTNVSVLLGSGDGTFTSSNPPFTGSGSVSMAVGDFNGDGDQDLAIGNFVDDSLTILPGDGAGSFTAGAQLPVQFSSLIASDDLNGDGVQDLLGSGGDGVSILLLGSRAATASTSVTLPPSTLDHNVVASYPGDSNYDASTSIEIQLPSAMTTPAITATASASTTAYGANVTLTAKMTFAGSPPTGSVSFLDGAVSLGGRLLTNGVAALTTNALGVGTHSITAAYAGDLNYNAATSKALSLTVSQGTPAVSLSASASSVLPGVPVTFTSTVNGGGVAPTGILTFLDGGKELSATRLSLGSTTANYTTSTLAAGSHSITASYSGDTNYLPAASPSVAVTVGATLKPTVTVAPASSSITLKQALTVAVAVNGGTGNPAVTGTVTLKGGGYASAAATLAEGDASFTIPAGSLAVGTDTLTATYTPDGASSSDYTSSSGAAAVTVTGGTGQVSLSATSLTFPSTLSGRTSTLPLTLTNTGTGSLIVSTVSITGNNPGSFSHLGNCGGHTIAPGATCTIDVTFAPTAQGSFSATLSIPDNAAGSPQSVRLSGTGALAAPAVSLSATSLSYGNENVGTRTATLSVTMNNSGTASLLIGSIAVTGASASSFDFANDCGTSLEVKASCTIHGHFIPTGLGAVTAAVTITDNAAGSPQKITLSGTGVNGPSVLLSKYSLSFPATAPGAKSTLPITLTNSGTENLTVTGSGVSGANPGYFTHTSNCGGHTIVPGATCTLEVTFAPTAAGSFSATLSIVDNAPDTPQTIVLKGAGS